MGLLFYNLRKTIIYTLLLLLLFLFSFLGFLYPSFNQLIFWLIVLGTIILTLKKIEYGVFISLVELFIGSKGYLFSFPISGYVVSLRLAIFLIVLFIYLVKVLKKRKIEFFQTNLWPSFLLFVLFLIYGFINGLVRNEGKIVFYDINAYFYLALIFPIFSVLLKKENIFKFIKLLSICALTLSLLTFIVLLDFSIFHYSPSLVAATRVEAKQLEKLEELARLPENARLAQTTEIAAEKLKLNWEEATEEKPIVYRWLKDTGLGEVSYLGGRFFRIFMASQFYVIIYLIILLTYLFYTKLDSFKKNIPLYLLIFFYLLITIISFSRSFWLGFIFIFFFLILGLPKRKIFKIISSLLVLILIFSISFYFIFPDLFNIFRSRLVSLFQPSSELAASNRMSLLKPILDKIKEKPLLGSGFGSLITFKSLIPGTDLVEYVKVYLYEWAYLDIMVKIGLLGLLSYLYFIFVVLKNGIMSLKKLDPLNYIIVKGLIASLIFLLTVHLTTPYLNHPLGLGFLMVSAASLFAYKNILKTNEN